MTIIVVACPVAHRGWVIRQWADAALEACGRAGLTPHFVLAAHPADPTPGVLADHLGRGVDVVTVGVERAQDKRTWHQPERFEEMADIRNAMLSHVRDIGPDLFLSVDSDILLHPDAVTAMVSLLDDCDAAGSAAFLSRGPRPRPDGSFGRVSHLAPNYARLINERMQRVWYPDATRRADVLMAIKLMSPAAYNVDYRPHPQGEDLGWSIACREAHLRFKWTSTVVSKHLMESACGAHEQHDENCGACVEVITRIDPRCGY